MSLLGIDVGTTGCKAAAFLSGGGCLAEAYREYRTIHDRPGWAELDARDVLDRVRSAIAEVARQCGADPVTALCVSSMGEAMTPVSEDRRILGRCILSSDLRGEEYAARLREEPGQEAFYRINPNILGPNYSAPKLMWLRDHRTEAFDKAWKYLLWGDLVAFMLGGEPMTSFSHANRTLLFDIYAETWSAPLLARCGIDSNKLPQPAPSGTRAGCVSASIANELGLPSGVAIVVGGHDQCCSALGAGLSEANKAVCGIGTFECITPLYAGIPQAEPMLQRNLNIEHSVQDGLYVSFIYNQSGALVRWFRDTFAQAEQAAAAPDDSIFAALAAEMPDDPTGLLVLPHFEMTGAPDFIADSAGVIAGLRTSTTRGEILKAIMEGATYYFVGSIAALRELGVDTSEFVATGGGAKSDAWLQIKADIFGVPFVRPKVTECGTLGAAILAGAATGVYTGVTEGVEQLVHRDRLFEPDEKRHAIYRGQHQRYLELYPALRSILKEL